MRLFKTQEWIINHLNLIKKQLVSFFNIYHLWRNNDTNSIQIKTIKKLLKCQIRYFIPL